MLDRNLDMRSDVQQYFDGAKTLFNVQVLPKGGVKRRPGLEHIVETTDATVENLRLWPYVDDFTGIEYIIKFEQLTGGGASRFDVFEQDGTVEASGIGTFGNVSPLKFQMHQNKDRLYVFSGSFVPAWISRSSGGVWSITNLTAGTPGPLPQHGFPDTAGSGVNHKIELKLVNWHDMDRFTLIVDGYETDPIVGITGTPATLVTNIKTAVEELDNIDSVTVDTISSTKYTIEFTGASVARFYDVVAGVDNFDQDTQDELVTFLTLQKGEPPLEDAWSDARGWPRTGVVYQGRLILGGTDSLPNVVWSSRAGSLFDFNAELDDDDFGFAVEAESTEGGRILLINIGQGHVQIFGSKAEHFIPASPNNPITPTTVEIKKATSIGSFPGAGVVNVEGSTLFLSRGGKALYEFIYDDSLQNYRTNDIAKISSDLFINFEADHTRLGYRSPTNEDTAGYIYLLPGRSAPLTVTDLDLEDNRILSYSFSPGDGISAWTVLYTRGVFQDIAVVGDGMFFLMLRYNFPEDSTISYEAIEKFNKDLYFDAGVIVEVSGGPDTVTTDLDWLIPSGAPQTEAFTVHTRVDGSLDAFKVLTNETAAIVTFGEPAVDTWQAGIAFPEVATDGAQVVIELMPLEDVNLGPLFGRLKRIYESWVSFVDTSHAIVQGEEVSFRELGISVLDSPPPVTTMRYRNDGMLGFDREAGFRITQDQPFPLEVAGVGLEAKV